MTRAPIMSGLTLKPPVEVKQADSGTVSAKQAPAKGQSAMVKTTTYMSRAVHEKLREIAFVERCSINDLMMEGLDAMLEKRSYPATKELTERAKAS